MAARLGAEVVPEVIQSLSESVRGGPSQDGSLFFYGGDQELRSLIR